MSLSLIMRGIYPQLSQETMRLIHPSAWKGNSANFANTAFSEVGATLRGLFLLRTDHQHRAVGMSHYRVRYAAHQRSSHSAEPPTAHHDQARTYVLGNLYDLLGAIALGHPQMLLGDLTSLLLDLLGLIVKDVFSSPS